MTLPTPLRLLAGAAAAALMMATPLAAQLTLNVRDADVRAFIQDAARVTGRTFIIDGRVQGKVSVVTDRPLSKAEYFEIFLSTLRANGLIAVPSAGGALRIQPVEGAAGQPGAVGRGVNRNQFVTEVIRLRSVDATSALETLRPLVSRDGSITANRSGRSLVVVDYADNISRIRQIIARIDTDNAATQSVALRNAGAREIATSLQQLLSGGGADASNGTSVVAIDGSNSLVLRGDPGTVARLAGIARDLDQRAAAGTEVRVYWLEHADAQKLVPVLQQLIGQAGSSVTTSSGNETGPGPGPASPTSTAAPSTSTASGNGIGGGGGISRRGPAIVTRYEGTNAVIIAANAEVQRTLGEVIRQLDTRREQVLVEAIIVELSEEATRKLGVQLAAGGPGGGAYSTYSNTSPNIVNIGGGLLSNELSVGTTTTTTANGTTTTTTTGNSTTSSLIENALNSLTGVTGITGGFAVDLGGGNYLGAILNAVQQDTKSNVLSTPSIVTLDNQPARILVGQEVPITTGQALSGNFDNAFRTVTRQNVGVQLEVKPQIGEGGAVKLFLRQEVSSISGAVSSTNSDLILNKREIQTTVTVDDGQIVALGGLLDDNERRTLEKTPILGDIPLLGELFRSRSRARNKTNLMVFIRPTILRNKDDLARQSAQRYGYLRARQIERNPDSEASIDALVRDYLGTVPPGAAERRPDDETVDGRIGAITTSTSRLIVRPVTDTPLTPATLPPSTAPAARRPTLPDSTP